MTVFPLSALVALLVLWAGYVIYRERKEGKSWGEIVAERIDSDDLTGLFRRRRGVRHDDDGNSVEASEGSGTDFD